MLFVIHFLHALTFCLFALISNSVIHILLFTTYLMLIALLLKNIL